MIKSFTRNFQSIIKPHLNTSLNTFVIRPMTSDDRAGIDALCATISYQVEMDELLSQHEEILADQIDFVGCHVLLDERNSLLHQYYLRLGFVNIPNIEQNDRIILLGKQF